MDNIVIKDRITGKKLIEISGNEVELTEELIEKRKKLLEETSKEKESIKTNE